MQLVYPTRPLKRDCACETQLFPFFMQAWVSNNNSSRFTTQLYLLRMQAYLITGYFQLSDTVVPDSGHNSTLIRMQAYFITGSFLLDSSLLSAQ